MGSFEYVLGLTGSHLKSDLHTDFANGPHRPGTPATDCASRAQLTGVVGA